MLLDNRALLFLPVGFLSFDSKASWDINMTEGVTDTSLAIYELHMLTFYICVAISVVVFGVMFWSMYHHRKSKGAVAKQFEESTAIEILWTVIPTIILAAIAIPATATLISIYDHEESVVDIQVTGYQWKWRYKYIGEDIDYFSVFTTPESEIRNLQEKNINYLLEVDNPLVVPINKKIRFLFTSNDVIHSWWVPALALKKDAIPGFINESSTKINKPGIYRGQCAELCGKNHGFMPIVIKAVTDEEYSLWLAEKQQETKQQALAATQDWDLSALIEKGEDVYNKNCSACHQITGVGLPPVFPSLKGSPIIKGAIKDHLDVVFNGKPGTAMSAFGAQLSAVDMAAVITYERNAWGNNSGDKLLPATVTTFMQGMEK